MSVEVLVDTNILVYAHIPQDTVKQERAIAALQALAATGSGAVSVQTLAEFYVTATSSRKFRTPMSVADATAVVLDLIDSWPIIDTTPQIVLEALRGARLYSLSYWDAQIWAAAKLNQIPVVYSEDGPAGATIEGVRYVNPLDGPRLLLVQDAPRAGYATKSRRLTMR